MFILLCIASALFPCTALVGTCHADEISSGDLTELSIRDLMEIEITTGARKSQTLANTAAAAFVITQEDIRRSGVTSIADALRMVPGLQVAKIDANKWAISSRGFNSRYANKLLVLMDGRSVYSPLYSGVFWNIQDTVLEDIDRIEVIRGPGAALWGANAVNGVINIITKSTYDTKGGLVSAGAGKEERGFGNFRFGDSLGENACYRIFGKYADRDESKLTSGRDAADDWDIYTIGFKTDWTPTATDSVLFEGNHYRSDDGQTMTFPDISPPYSQTFNEDAKSDGVNFLASWERFISNTSDMKLQIYYDRARIEQTALSNTTDTYDLDFQHRFSPREKHEIIWGIGYRLISFETNSSPIVIVDPENRTDDILSAFVQDDITIVQDHLRLTLGAKFEHNDYSGFEFQPNIRTLWTPDKHNSIWASFSRAVRTPSRIENDVHTNLFVIPPGTPQNPSGLPMVISNIATGDFKPESLYAYEMGYRNEISKSASIDIAAFYNRYKDLRSHNYNTPFSELNSSVPHIVLPIAISNDNEGHTYGIEAFAELKPLSWWKIKPAYSFLHVNLSEPTEDSSGEAPRHQFSFQSNMDLPMNLELDLWLRYVDDLSDSDVNSYSMVDARLGWKPAENFEISLVGQNIFDSQHQEFKEDYLNYATYEVERAFYIKATWHF
ncbi:MAG: TonB-dependent receptor [Proteobacteria bacterium]|nr:TonB-dependent receptor [Pseudomonadota bacterium]